MKRNILFMFFLLPFIAMGQTYKYIGIEDGLSNRRIFNIQKDSKGYMWFLTNEGMDRYNGKEIKHYKLADEENKRNAQNHLTWLFREKENLWIVGKTGKIFEYHHLNFSSLVANFIPKLPIKRHTENIYLNYVKFILNLENLSFRNTKL